MEITTPEWVKHAVFYQIFPDRFARSERMTHSRGIQFKPWGTAPAEQGYQGGDLYGIVDKLDYLKDLGITALYLNPIFSAASNHRYNAYDYLEVDPLLGGKPALRELLDEAHKRGIRIVLDGVFNHCGRGFWAFHHILENGGNSPYIDWFHIHEFPLHPYPAKKQKINYSGWWNEPSLPKFNTDNPGVRDYIMHVAKYWLDFGIDGWRLDVPAEIDDDSFWQEFRQVVKGANPEAYIVGEIWHEAKRWLQGDMFDAVMNYIITNNLLGFFGGPNLNRKWKHPHVTLPNLTGLAFARRMNAMHALYDWEINFAQLNMLDSHDMPRALWLLNNDVAALRLATLCQMTMPGAPCVYYGAEVGLSAGTDPHCREAFPWPQPERWNTDLRAHFQAAIALRHAHPALRTGKLAFVHTGKRTVAYTRRLGKQEVLVAFNAGLTPAQVSIPARKLHAKTYTHAWGAAQGSTVSVDTDGLTLTLPPQSAVVLAA